MMKQPQPAPAAAAAPKTPDSVRVPTELDPDVVAGRRRAQGEMRRKSMMSGIRGTEFTRSRLAAMGGDDEDYSRSTLG